MNTKYDLYERFLKATKWMSKNLLRPGKLTQKDWDDYMDLKNRLDIAFRGMSEKEIKEFENSTNII